MRISKAITFVFVWIRASIAVPAFGQDEGRRQRGGAQGVDLVVGVAPAWEWE